MTKTIQQLFDLSNRVAVVTGGSRGLGLEIAEGLAEAGAALMLCARRKEWLDPTLEAMRARGVRAEGRVCDVSDAGQVQAVVDAALAAFGRIDILVNNAGVSWGQRPEEMALEKWQRGIDTNLTGAFLFAQAAGRLVLQARLGSSINIAPVACVRCVVAGRHVPSYSG